MTVKRVGGGGWGVFDYNCISWRHINRHNPNTTSTNLNLSCITLLVPPPQKMTPPPPPTATNHFHPPPPTVLTVLKYFSEDFEQN